MDEVLRAKIRDLADGFIEFTNRNRAENELVRLGHKLKPNTEVGSILLTTIADLLAACDDDDRQECAEALIDEVIRPALLAGNFAALEDVATSLKSLKFPRRVGPLSAPDRKYVEAFEARLFLEKEFSRVPYKAEIATYLATHFDGWEGYRFKNLWKRPGFTDVKDKPRGHKIPDICKLTV